MAIQTKTLTFTAEDSKTFLFTKPPGTYGKTAPGLTLTSGSPAAAYYSADVDNGNDTMTGTVNFAGPVTGTVEIAIYDR